MKSNAFTRTLAVAALTLLSSAATAQPTVGAAGDAGDASAREDHAIIRADLALEMVNRTFELEGPSEVLYDAPFYAGLRVRLELFPLALWRADSPAAALGFRFMTSKHSVNTVAAYEVEDEFYDFEVPTRHDVTHLALFYEWQAMDRLVVTPRIAWHTAEFGLGYNPLYRDSFYRGIEVGARADLGLKVEGLTLGLGIGVRPSVDLGSTADPYGTTSSSFGLAIEGGARYTSRLGLYGAFDVQFDRYSSTYRPDRNDDRADSTSVDRFRGLVFALGYEY